MAELTSTAIHSMIDLTVKNNSGTKSILNQHHYEVTNVTDFWTAHPQLCQASCVSIVIYRDWHSNHLFQFIRDVPVPPLEMGNEQCSTSFKIH